MNDNAFYLTIEAIISFILLASIISFPIDVQKNTYERLGDLYIIQLENDLLKVWNLSEGINEEEMVKDFKFVFPEKNGLIEINGEEIFIGGKGGKENVATGGIIFADGILNEIKVSVFK